MLRRSWNEDREEGGKGSGLCASTQGKGSGIPRPVGALGQLLGVRASPGVRTAGAGMRPGMAREPVPLRVLVMSPKLSGGSLPSELQRRAGLRPRNATVLSPASEFTPSPQSLSAPRKLNLVPLGGAKAHGNSVVSEIWRPGFKKFWAPKAEEGGEG